MSDPKPHSAEYFGDSRDFWWNADFLALMARRWDLGGVRKALDVGCGVGHWGRALRPHLPPEAHVTGIDREPKWVAKATEIASARGIEQLHSYVQGVADALPFPDASFDLATCQTVLIHVPDPARVITEMLRVLKPGGLLLAVEPNNLAGGLVFDSVSADAPVDDIVTRFRFHLTCERGKAALGEGNNSVGGKIPGLFARLGLANIQVFISDKASVVRPPYDDPEGRAIARETLDWSGRDFWVWSKPDTKRYFIAGGGMEGEFDSNWSVAMDHSRRAAEAIRAGTFESPGGQVGYLVSGRRR